MIKFGVIGKQGNGGLRIDVAWEIVDVDKEQERTKYGIEVVVAVYIVKNTFQYFGQYTEERDRTVIDESSFLKTGDMLAVLQQLLRSYYKLFLYSESLKL